MGKQDKVTNNSFKNRLYIIFFESDTAMGKAFDILLFICILISVLAILLNSVVQIHESYGNILLGLQWFFTIVFTIEYILRLYCARSTFKYIRSFFGIIDLLAILPNYIIVFIIGVPALSFIRVFRLLRIFVVFKLGRYMGQANFMLEALKSGFRKIIVFIGSVLAIVVIMGSLMYLIEGPENGYINIPKSMYWAIVTLTTVGYGDIAPKTVLGQFIASIIMLLGYGIIAVPTGILSAEIALGFKEKKIRCKSCGKYMLGEDSSFCRFCGAKIIKIN